MEVPGTHPFTLTDAHGVAHSYLCNEHPAGEGMAVMYELLALGVPALAGLAAAALKSQELLVAAMAALAPEREGEAAVGAADLARMVSELDLGSVGAELGRALSTGKAPELTRRILSRTWRDGKPLGQVFDQAYQANYAELLAAVWKVCTINRFFPVPRTSASSPGAATGAMAAN